MDLNVGWSFLDLASVTNRSLCAVSLVLLWSLVQNLQAKAYSNGHKSFPSFRVRVPRFYTYVDYLALIGKDVSLVGTSIEMPRFPLGDLHLLHPKLLDEAR